ncbi:MAG TPA: GNAT family N-acetyltransferase [Mycobacteriales bacterium]|nr:GNAT family N-acetyltransferase [Mycobacteriales bacterium]
MPTPQDPQTAVERLTDLDLLRIEMGVLWGLDAQHRVGGPVELAVGVAPAGIIAAVGQRISDDVTNRVLELVADGVPPRPGAIPSFVDSCRELLTAEGPGELVLSGGPSYHVAPPVHFAGQVSVLRSDSAHADQLLNRRPDNWEPDEWIELIGGGTGAPWAMVLDRDRVVSICHTPARTAAAAEAGTWTAPEFRKRGYAAATTAAWADLLSPYCPHLFYSTSADNHSSQHVAGRLELRPIGWTWKLTAPKLTRTETQPTPTV